MKVDSDLVAFVFADRVGDTMTPLTDSTCLALLPVAGKPLIDHGLDRRGHGRGAAHVHRASVRHSGRVTQGCLIHSP